MMALVAFCAFALSALYFYDAYRCQRIPRMCDRHMKALRVLQGIAALGFAIGYLPNATAGRISEEGIMPLRTSMLALLIAAGAEVIARWNCKK